MRIRKLLSVLFAVSIGCTCISLSQPPKAASVIAAEVAETTIWDGTEDISWYDDEEKELHIRTAEELAGFASLTNAGKTFAGKTVYLDNDVYLNDISNVTNWETTRLPNKWTPAASHLASPFEGTFDGQGNRVVGLYGIFIGCVDGTVQNLVMEGGCARFSSWDSDTVLFYGYAFCYQNKGTIRNCVSSQNVLMYPTFQVNSNNQQEGNLAGMVMYNYGTITNCTYSGTALMQVTVKSTNSMVVLYGGGVCCRQTDSGSTLRSLNTGTVRIETVGTKRTCGQPTYVGGICAYSHNSYKGDTLIKGCKNAGKISVSSDYTDPPVAYASGICGKIDGTMHSCYNIGEISSVYKAGGLYGVRAGTEQTIYNCYNAGTLSGESGIGAICGEASTSTKYWTGAYYLNTTAPSGGSELPNGGADAGISKTAENMMKPSFADSLGSEFQYVENHFPMLTWETPPAKQGDLNGDGTFDSVDVSMLQQWLLGLPDAVIVNWEAADFNGNGQLDANDLTLMKRALRDAT